VDLPEGDDLEGSAVVEKTTERPSGENAVRQHAPYLAPAHRRVGPWVGAKAVAVRSPRTHIYNRLPSGETARLDRPKADQTKTCNRLPVLGEADSEPCHGGRHLRPQPAPQGDDAGERRRTRQGQYAPIAQKGARPAVVAGVAAVAPSVIGTAPGRTSASANSAAEWNRSAGSLASAF